VGGEDAWNVTFLNDFTDYFSMNTVELFERYADRYDSWYDRHRDWFLKEIELIKNVAGDFKLGLEVGVGTGRFAKELGIRYGIDLANAMLKLAKSRGVEVIKADALHLPFKDKTFDLVLLAFTLCFLDDPLKALIEASKVLRDDGAVVICCVPSDSMLGREYSQKKDSPFYSNAKLYSVNEITAMLEIAKLKVEKVEFADLKYGRDVVCIKACKR